MAPLLQTGNQSCTGTTSNPHRSASYIRNTDSQRGQPQLGRSGAGIQSLFHVGTQNMSSLADGVNNKRGSSVRGERKGTWESAVCGLTKLGVAVLRGHVGACLTMHPVCVRENSPRCSPPPGDAAGMSECEVFPESAVFSHGRRTLGEVCISRCVLEPAGEANPERCFVSSCGVL